MPQPGPQEQTGPDATSASVQHFHPEIERWERWSDKQCPRWCLQDALGRESALEQKLGMAQYGQQMAEAQNAALGAGLQQRESLLQVRTRLRLVCSFAHAGGAAYPAMKSLCKMQGAPSHSL